MKNGVAYVQSVANLGGARIKIDGISGPVTRQAVRRIPSDVIVLIERTLDAHGLPGLDDIIAPAPAVTAQREFPDVWYDLVEAAKAILPKYGINPGFALAQFAIESDWGRKPSGKNNFGGIKANSVGHSTGTTTMTSEEYKKGVITREKAVWADFSSVQAFVEGYALYLTNSASSYRYPGITSAASAREFFSILKKGGYATSSAYVSLGTDVYSSVKRRNFA